MAALWAPLEAPSMDMFGGSEQTGQNAISATETLPLPEGGLPDGWTMEQWQHYGHQYSEIQESTDGQDEK